MNLRQCLVLFSKKTLYDMQFSVMMPYLSIVAIMIYSVLKDVTTVYDRYLKQNFVKDDENQQ